MSDVQHFRDENSCGQNCFSKYTDLL